MVRARPTLGETALAVDAEGGPATPSRPRWPSRAPIPGAAGPAAGPEDETIVVDAGFDIAEAETRFVRRQRRDALTRLRAVQPNLFRPRLARRPAGTAILAAALMIPAVLLPNPMDLVIQQNRQVREEAQHQADRIEEIAKDLEGRGANANDPRTQLSQELRELAQRLRSNPGDLDRNLAQLGSVEDSVRSQLDPANEQRAASLAALSRALSRSATKNPRRTRAVTRSRPATTSRTWATRSTR